MLKVKLILSIVLDLIVFNVVGVIILPGSCKSGQYYDSSDMTCSTCPANTSMVPSENGFSCTCDESSIPWGVSGCRRCGASEVVSADGGACVPRRCQKDSAGRLACRKCPADYIQVTQNVDGSSLREAQCVRCARGFRSLNNRCVRCPACTCDAKHAVVRGVCVPKKYIADRPKYEGEIHPDELLDIVKFEYLCTAGDNVSCSHLAGLCVRSFYTTDQGGPCRLWLYRALQKPKGLPKLTLDPADVDASNPGVIQLDSVYDEISLVIAAFRRDGSMRMYQKPGRFPSCFLPRKVKIVDENNIKGETCDVDLDVVENIFGDDTLAAYIYVEDSLRPVPVTLITPNGSKTQNEMWSLRKFRRYFVLDNSLSTVANVTNTIYLKALIVNMNVHAQTSTRSSKLNVSISLEAQYAAKSPSASSVVTSLKVVTVLPRVDDGMTRALEVSGGVLGAVRGVWGARGARAATMRGGALLAALPLLAAALADTLYFSGLISTLHAMGARAASLAPAAPDAALPLLSTFMYCALAFKLLKVVYANWRQCTCDVFFLDWSLYYPTAEGVFPEKNAGSRAVAVAREWRRLQTHRRVSATYLACTTLVILFFIQPWFSRLQASVVYLWAILSISCWCAALLLYSARWLLDKVFPPHYVDFTRTCSDAGVSLLVFQDEYYAHYVHGSNDEILDARGLTGPLSSCRVVCAPQLRMVYKQLSTTVGLVTLETPGSRKVLLTRFLAAFFERALDGFTWVGRERSLSERVWGAASSPRVPPTSSELLYDLHDHPPSALNMTWYGEEWSLLTLDMLVLSAVTMATARPLVAALALFLLEQVGKFVVDRLCERNIMRAL